MLVIPLKLQPFTIFSKSILLDDVSIELTKVVLFFIHPSYEQKSTEFDSTYQNLIDYTSEQRKKNDHLIIWLSIMNEKRTAFTLWNTSFAFCLILYLASYMMIEIYGIRHGRISNNRPNIRSNGPISLIFMHKTNVETVLQYPYDDFKSSFSHENTQISIANMYISKVCFRPP